MSNLHPDRWGLHPIPERVLARVFERVEPGHGGCWLSTYSVASHGYAQIGWQQRGFRTMTTAHRVAWTATHGPVPVGMTVDHLCRVRRCVNPAHLRLLTNHENGRRNHPAYGDWPLGQCRHGHPDHAGRGPCRACRAGVPPGQLELWAS